MKIIQLSTGLFVKQLHPFVLTTIESDAQDFTDEEIDGVIETLEQEQGESFAKGRPTDRQPKQ